MGRERLGGRNGQRMSSTSVRHTRPANDVVEKYPLTLSESGAGAGAGFWLLLIQAVTSATAVVSCPLPLPHNVPPPCAELGTPPPEDGNWGVHVTQEVAPEPVQPPLGLSRKMLLVPLVDRALANVNAALSEEKNRQSLVPIGKTAVLP